MAFKKEVYEVCEMVANEFPGWKFVSGNFKNISMKHSDLIVSPSFSFDHGFANLQPCVMINHKRSNKLYKKIIGYGAYVSQINFQEMAFPLTYMPEHLRATCMICEDKKSYLAAVHAPSQYYDKQRARTLEDGALDITQSIPVLKAIMKDGIAFIEKHYDLSSEEAFLKALPAKYDTRNNIPYREMELQKGVMMCIVHILLGDFDFFELYCSDRYKTVFPKRSEELAKISAAVSGLKREYEKTGKII